MATTPHTQSVSEFGRTTAETLARLDRTGDAEVLTVDGQARAVLLSPAAYEDLRREPLSAHDVAVMREAVQQVERGEYVEARVFFDELHAELLAMKAAEGGETGR